MVNMDLPLCWCATFSPPLLSLTLSVLRTLGWLSHPPCFPWPCQYYVPTLGWLSHPPLIFFDPVSITYPRATPPACMNLSDTGEPGLICRCEHFPEFPTKLFKPFKKFVSMLNNHLLLNSLISGINKLSVRECKNHFLNIHQFEYIELSK